jgi:hypothetical protein
MNISDCEANCNEKNGPFAGASTKWARTINQPPKASLAAAVRRSVETGLAFGDMRWVAQLA